MSSVLLSRHKLTAIGSLLWLAQVAIAQTPPSAGTLFQQMERSFPPHATPVIPFDSSKPKRVGPDDGEVTMTVKAFRFVGNVRLTEPELQQVVTPYVARKVSFAELQDVLAAVMQAYRDIGVIARAFLPEQDITSGEITIQILEAFYGQTLFQGARPSAVSIQQLFGIADHTLISGQPVGTPQVERALLLLKDLAGVQVDGQLVPGSRPGETSLLLSAVDLPVMQGVATLDNSGSRSTGAQRALAALMVNSPLHFGDQLVGNAAYTEGSTYGRLGYYFPVGYGGWRLGVNASSMDYRLITADFADLQAKGSSRVIGGEATYPIFRSAGNNLNWQFNADQKTFANHANGETTSQYVINTATLGIAGNFLDGYGGENFYSAGWTSGNLNLNGSPNQAADRATTQAAGRFSKIKGSYSRRQALAPQLSAGLSMSAQLANRNLDSAEKFYLGGPSGVRAYPNSEGGGSEGFLVSLEINQKLSSELFLAGFLDSGRVMVNVHNNFTGAPVLNSYSLTGVGLALGWDPSSNTSLKATWSHRLGHNPNPTLTGQDQDGTLFKNRFWLQASLSF